MSERIDHTNYEAWLLDRMEGNLSAEQEALLDAFLAANPELAPIGSDLPSISATDLPSFNKDVLKRNFPPDGSVSEASIDDHLIARLEGDLSPEQSLALKKFLYEHPEYAKADRTYALTKLVPHAMEFAAKKELVRRLPPEGLVTKYTLEDHLIARLEGDLSNEQEKALDVLLKQDASAVKEWALVSRTKVSADRVSYPERSELKKGGRVISIGAARPVIRYAAAASIALLLSFGIWLALQPRSEEQFVNVDRKERNEQDVPKVGTSTSVVDPVQERIEEGEGSYPTVVESGSSIEPLVAEIQTTENISAGPIGTEEIPEREEVHFAEQRKITLEPELPSSDPISVAVQEAPVEMDELASIESDQMDTQDASRSIGTVVASAVREKVLGSSSEEIRPLDRSDAVAAVDKGLKAITGGNSGLAVQQNGGKIRRFNLRVGDLAITASTGR